MHAVMARFGAVRCSAAVGAAVPSVSSRLATLPLRSITPTHGLAAAAAAAAAAGCASAVFLGEAALCDWSFAGATAGPAAAAGASAGDPDAIEKKIQRLAGNTDRLSLRGPIKVFTGNAHPSLAQDICGLIDVPLSAATVKPFKNGEINVIIHESVRECDCYIVQPTCDPIPNEYLMELLLLMDGMRRGGASRITAVIPLFGYARQDKKDRSRAPITAKLVTDMLQLAGADRVITVDLHASQIQGFANYPIDNLYGMPLISKWVEMEIIGETGSPDDLVIVSPDAGGAKRADKLAKKLGSAIAIFSKNREKANEVAKMVLVGNVKGKKALLLDDMTDTAGTLTIAAKQLLEFGATEVYAAVIHGVLSDPAASRITNSPIKKIVCLDTIPMGEKKAKCEKLEVISCAEQLAAAILSAHFGESLNQVHFMDNRNLEAGDVLFHDN
eukprot:SAG22_NODE_134_length_18372_cov_33.054944_8_plen_443_part_00